MARITWKQVAPPHMYGYPGGWEIYLKDGIPQISNNVPMVARKNLRLEIKGMKKLLKSANKIGFFEKVGGSYTGNANTVIQKYDKIITCVKNAKVDGYNNGLCAIGDGCEYVITDYVDGSYDIRI